MIEYYILTRNPEFEDVIHWLDQHSVALDIHLNRTRFKLDPYSKLHTEFCLRYSMVCAEVDSDSDLTTGLTSDQC